MCKKVRELNGIPQYKFCDEYKEAKSRLDVALDDLETAKFDVEFAERKIKEIREKHWR